MSKSILSTYLSDDIELKFDADYRAIVSEKNNNPSVEYISLSDEYDLIKDDEKKNTNTNIKLKRFGLRNALLLGSFWFAFLMPCACTSKNVDVVEVEQTVEPETIEETPIDEPDVTPVEPEVVEPETEVEPEVVEPEEVEPVEINPRDMKAVYGLDYDVPIYTEEEIEQAKVNLTSNYDDYIIEDSDKWYTVDQKKDMAPDYYAANQDLFCQLNDMVSEFDGKSCYNGSDKIYYDEENDMYMELTKYTLTFYGKKFMYQKAYGISKFAVDIGDIIESNEWMQVGPGAFVYMDSIGSYEWEYNFYETKYNENGAPFSELEEHGFKPQKLKFEAVLIEDENYSLELK